MYTEKVKEKPSVPIQKKTTPSGSDSHVHKGIHKASPTYGSAFENSAFSGPLQLHASSHYYGADVIQLKGKKDDVAKLVPPPQKKKKKMTTKFLTMRK